ncbi:diaminopropionate ammonia-lyase [Marinicauda salina]|uniref:Diaminopropionate ammonia-lyase n=1 Tax=Marinicauda salina TaxID=2135793 RepID=A0A2U2BUJ6_9PROT|nr:diaminopropionate ammonia-lyase [Marinicauda salina]PWE17634.1 diaminopropionate ammonia-lyase [Marinicauda salina]
MTAAFHANPEAGRPARLSERALARFGPDAGADPLRLLAACPLHAPTPMLRLDGLAADLGVRRVWWKDERERLGLTSFKALGGAYAVAKILERAFEDRHGRAPAPEELRSDAARAVAQALTVTAATDGNHGLSVAAGAMVFGLNCVIFVHKRVTAERRARIEAKGAEVRIVDGVFDDAVAEAARAAEAGGWTLVADTSADAEDLVCGDVQQGYGVLCDEIDRQLDAAGAAPSHVFIQAGVGGLAAAVIAGLAARRGADRPTGVCVEPEAAPALFGSMRAGRAVRADDAGGTAMEMLDCYEPAALAFEALGASADVFMTVDDETARDATALLTGVDPAIGATETAAAGLAGLIAALDDPEARELCGLGADSEIVLIGSEGPVA